MIRKETVKSPGQILVYGIGNPGRQDDAVGILLTDRIGKWAGENNHPGIHIEHNYQLNIEDSELISGFDLVIFVDASVKNIDSILLEEVVPDLKTDFSMHSVEPRFVLGLCQQVFNKFPKCYQLHIKGISFDFMEPPTKTALDNLEQAFIELSTFLAGRYSDF